MIQLDFFKDENDLMMEHIQKDLDAVRRSSDKVRRGMYARLNELSKENKEIKEEFESWKRNVCIGV